MNIMLDLDGCLVDFNKGVSRIYWTIKELNNIGYEWNTLTSDLIKQYLVYNFGNINIDKLPSKKLWALVSKYGDNFWTDLEWMPDGELLWNYVNKFHPTILTGLSTSKNCDPEKRIWCARELGDYVNVITCRSDEKSNWENSETLLIDDRIENCKAWAGRGGPFIHHKNSKQTIEELSYFGF